ncbi:DUF202 domain-containing protein [Agromyces sp. G08B096]|uniref:DUF202 domain-containing protein n=1 Tax=Agromyces sp. G08B096 TaxID=3156399 RepID=A0AAU7WCF5_9MICO
MPPFRLAATADPGLQPERTALSWSRTAFAVAANALLSLRAGLVAGEPWLVAVGVLLFGTAGAVVVIAAVRRRQLAGAELTITPPRGALAGVTAAAVLAAAGGVASVLVERSAT